jgi:hypothetical protein
VPGHRLSPGCKSYSAVRSGQAAANRLILWPGPSTRAQPLARSLCQSKASSSRNLTYTPGSTTRHLSGEGPKTITPRGRRRSVENGECGGVRPAHPARLQPPQTAIARILMIPPHTPTRANKSRSGSTARISRITAKHQVRAISCQSQSMTVS